jgi:hypothetical protein
MSRLLLIPVTFVVVLFTGWMLHRGGFPGCPGPAGSSIPTVQTASHDSSLSEAALRYRQCQPHHWRSLMIQQH